MRALAAAATLALCLSGATLAAAGASAFPFDFLFRLDEPSLDPTLVTETFHVPSDSKLIVADLEDFDLLAARYDVHLLMKPPGCASPADWFDGGWNLPDHADVLAPIEWDAHCDISGVWTIEVTAQAERLALGGLRVHFFEAAS